jgi:transmembrane sensor
MIVMHIPEQILTLIEKFENATASAEEVSELQAWYASFDDSAVEVLLQDGESAQQISHHIMARLLVTIQQVKEAPVATKRRWWSVPAAAVLLVLFAAGIYLLMSKNSPQSNPVVKTIVVPPAPVTDIAPGGNKALLTLADGSTVVLDSAANGTITTQGNISVQKLANGAIEYQVGGKTITENDAAFYNTISTPRGGQYQVTLSDGTKVWLNAASSIRFPVLFIGMERRVQITGEAYFEVEKDALKPFKVTTAGSEVEVLGTHFNINAYEDEPGTKTTLLEGKVKVSYTKTDKNAFLDPGQQAAFFKNGKLAVINNADTEEALAWKNGRFQFKSADVKTILRQISRWYDVDVEYHGNVNLHFTGQLTRNEYVSKVFEKLALTGEVNFKIDGKKIIVSP